jgi:hypothetical protein
MTMSAKKFDLEKTLGKKVQGRVNAAGVPDRFGQAAADAIDKREQRRRDAAAGLVPFACKLPLELTRQLQELATAHDGGMNALVNELLAEALKKSTQVAQPKGDAEESAAKEPAAKKVAAKKTAAKKAAG